MLIEYLVNIGAGINQIECPLLMIIKYTVKNFLYFSIEQSLRDTA
jgi:hypothetical protein